MWNSIRIRVCLVVGHFHNPRGCDSTRCTKPNWVRRYHSTVHEIVDYSSDQRGWKSGRKVIVRIREITTRNLVGNTVGWCGRRRWRQKGRRWQKWRHSRWWRGRNIARVTWTTVCAIASVCTKMWCGWRNPGFAVLTFSVYLKAVEIVGKFVGVGVWVGVVFVKCFKVCWFVARVGTKCVWRVWCRIRWIWRRWLW